MTDSGKIFEVSTETSSLFLSQKCFLWSHEQDEKKWDNCQDCAFSFSMLQSEIVAAPVGRFRAALGWGWGVGAGFGKTEIKLPIASEDWYNKINKL